EHAALALGEIGALEVTLCRRLFPVGIHSLALRGQCQRIDERMLRRDHHVGCAEDRVGTGREYLQVAERRVLEREKQFGALTASDPRLLHAFRGVGPVEILQAGEQPVGVSGNPQHPLAKCAAFDGMAAHLGLAVNDLLIGEHRLERGAPPDRALVDVREPAAEKLKKDPLRPAEVLRISRVDLALPVVGEPERLDLSPKIGDIRLRVGGWMRAGFHGMLLGRKSEGVPAHRMQHIKAAGALVARENVGRGVPLRMTDVQTRARRVGEHIEHVVLRFAATGVGAERMVFLPEGLPVRFDRRKVVVFAMRCHRRKPATLRHSPTRSIPLLFLAAWLVIPMASTTSAAMSGGFQRLMEAVVRIDVREVAYEAGSRRFSSGVGSGVIMSKDGYILTNAHVASPRAVDINITLANLERVGARLVGWDHWTDLALLQ